MSRSSVRMAPESNLETKYAKEKVNTKFKGDISPSRAGAPMHADARDAQESYTQIYQDSGGGRTEITRDRVKRQQTDRSKNDNRTRAHRTVIMVGATSADGWAASPAKKQVAAIKRRAGQNVGPLPFEAIIESCEPIINRKETAKRWIRMTRDTIPITSCNRVYVILKSRKLFLDKKTKTGVPTI